MYDLLWDLLNVSIEFIEEMILWNEPHRPLFAEGLRHVLYRLHDVKKFADYMTAAKKLDRIRDEKAIQAANHLVASVWTMFVPFMLEESGVFIELIASQLVDYISALTMEISDLLSLEKDKIDMEDNDRASYCIASVCLLLGRLMPRQLQKMLAENEALAQSLQQSATLAMRSQDEQLQKMSVYLFRETIRHMNLSSEKMQEMVPSLMTLLDSQDTVSMAVITMLADILVNDPSRGLEQAFRRLDSGNNAQRKNALNLIAEVIKLSHDLSHLDKRFRQSLAESLLRRLHDEELQTRTQTSKLFSHLDLEYILPRLVRLELDRNTKVRSAAHSTLVHIMAAHSDSDRAFLVLLSAVQDEAAIEGRSTTVSSSKSFVSPGDIGNHHSSRRDFTSSSSSLEVVERVFSQSFVQHWSKSVSASVFASVLQSLIAKLFEQPHNPLLVNVLSKISRQEQSVLKHCSLILNMVLDGIKRHRDRSVSSEDLEAKRQLLFDHLSPFLILKTLPLSCFAQSGSCETVTQELASLIMESLLTGSEDNYFEQVHRVAAEVLARFPLNMFAGETLSAAYRFVSVQLYHSARLLLFTLVNAIALHGPAFQPYAQKMQDLAIGTLSTPGKSGDIELEKLQMGCIECLGILISRVALHINEDNNSDRDDNSIIDTKSSKPMVEEIDDGSASNESSRSPRMPLEPSIVASIVDSIKREAHPQDPQLQICLFNALTTATRSMKIKQLNIFADMVCNQVNSIVADSKRPLVIRCAGLQLLLHLTYQMKESIHPYCDAILRVVQMAVSTGGHDADQLRLAGLKLLSAVLAVREDVLLHHAHIMEPILKSVSSLATMDSSQQVRSLAQQLHDILMKSDM